jgi:hypothetical protein
MDAKNDVLVVVNIYDNATQASIAKSMLDSAGIYSMLNDEYMSALYTTTAFPLRLMVRQEDVEDALALLDNR